MSQKDWLEKDYYKILGISKTAKPAEIKKAFRKIARESHPDQHPGDAVAEQRFKEASEAHDVLSNPEKRKEYDEIRRYGGGFSFPRGGGSSGGAGVPNMDDLFSTMGGNTDRLSDMLGNLFGGGMPGSASGSASRGRQARKGSDVEGDVSISFLQAVEGATVSMQLVENEACTACRGTGAKAGTSPRVCPTCSGSGFESSGQGMFNLGSPCRTCGGRGVIIDDPCEVCHGTGRANSTRTIQVRIPAGVNDGQKVRITGKGGAGEYGGARGDLYVNVSVQPHPVFGRNGNNLTVAVPITFPEAVLGAEIEVPTLQGAPVRLRIPAGTPTGRTFRVKDKGIKKAASTGDLMVTVEVATPASLNAEAKEALRKYQELAAEPNPRTSLLARA